MEWSHAALLVTWLALATAAPRYSSRIVHTDAGAIRGIIVEPASRRLEPVEVFLGVPYAAAPARLAAPRPAPPWSGTRLADTPPSVCPQHLPDISNKSAALASMPLTVYEELRAMAPLLVNQSEDCLHLNIYVPGSGARGVEAPYAVVIWAGGSSLEWGAAAAVDGSVLAARAHVLLVTLNYRLGLLGFLTAGAGPSAALQDAVAALRWVRHNIAAFGGDPLRITLAGHAAGATFANTLLMMPETKGIISRAFLLSGSALAPGAVQTAAGAARAREEAARALRCPTDEQALIECIRSRPLSAILTVLPPAARFLPRWSPSPPSTSPHPAGAPSPARALHASEAFLECALAVVITTTESYQFFGEEDIRHGFEEEHRNRILRTYVRNIYRYHRNEIFAAIRNEYTDWEKPIQHPINIRDATLEALSDAAAAAPAVRLAQLHARRGARTYFAHFAHQTKDTDYPQRLGSVTAEALPYFLGLPLVGGPWYAPHNYSRGDVVVAEAAVALLAGLAKSGEPAPSATSHHDPAPLWPRYELNTQQYLTISSKPRVRSHYRGHKLALWLHLVPQLHRPGAAPRHHQFRSTQSDMFSGEVFPEPLATSSAEEDEDASEEARAAAEECEPIPSPRPALPALPPRAPDDHPLNNIDSHYYSYTVALAVTVGAGCFLLALNVVVFAGLYLQRNRRRGPAAGEGSCSTRGVSLRSDQPSASPRKSSLKRSSESELKESPLTAPLVVPLAALPAKKRVQIQEISV